MGNRCVGDAFFLRLDHDTNGGTGGIANQFGDASLFLKYIREPAYSFGYLSVIEWDDFPHSDKFREEWEENIKKKGKSCIMVG